MHRSFAFRYEEQHTSHIYLDKEDEISSHWIQMGKSAQPDDMDSDIATGTLCRIRLWVVSMKAEKNALWLHTTFLSLSHFDSDFSLFFSLLFLSLATTTLSATQTFVIFYSLHHDHLKASLTTQIIQASKIKANNYRRNRRSA